MPPRKFSEYGLPWAIKKKDKPKNKRTSSHRYKIGNDIRRQKKMTRVGDDWFVMNDDKQELAIEFEMEWRCYEHDSFDYDDGYYTSCQPIMTNKKLARDNFLDFYDFYLPKKTEKDEIVGAIRGGNIHTIRKLLDHKKHVDTLMPTNCKICATDDIMIKKYLIYVEGKRHSCYLYRDAEKFYNDTYSDDDIQLSYEQHFIIKKLYEGKCLLCLTFDENIHRYLIHVHRVKPCRKYDCLGYESYIFEKDFPYVLSKLYALRDSLRLNINREPVIGDILSMLMGLNPDLMREFVEMTEQNL